MSVRLLSKRFPAIRRGFGKPIGKLEDTSGSSVVLALAFFLICAIVGSIILTAASVNAKTVATYKETQQAEYTVTSAAGLWADWLNGSSAEWVLGDGGQPDFVNSVYGVDAAVNPTYPTKSLIKSLWVNYGDEIWPKRNVESYTIPATFTVKATSLTGEQPVDPVYAQVTFDRDFNIVVVFSLKGFANGAVDQTSLYNLQLTMQATPTFDSDGSLTSISWGSPKMVKLGSALQEVG
ncbi:hypothetical protein [Raoultibacter timonensis]|uniref:hypothetical protein n=1 Tax=Raoultibacter timonensis TaxID=1907662 RepID=UPI0026DD3B66|nr:hypothetical protein [Raoultibacter timonensis]